MRLEPESYQDTEFEQQLTILKGSKLVEELHGKEISYENVMQAVEAISDRAEIYMLKYYKDVVLYAISPQQKSIAKTNG